MRLKLPTTVASSAASASRRAPSKRVTPAPPTRRVRRPAAGAVADAAEDDREQRVGQPSDALGVELRVVDHDGTVVVVFERDRVDGTDRAVLGSQHDPLVAVEIDDLVVEGYAPAEESGHETEPRTDPDRLGREHLARFDAGIPLRGAIEATEVGERSGPRDGDRNSCDVASHRPSPFGGGLTLALNYGP